MPELGERAPEFRDVLGDVLDDEQMLLSAQRDGASAPFTGEVLVVPHSVDRCPVFVAALGALDVDLIVKHNAPSIESGYQHD
ncbi:hypothetical protein IB277_34705 [Ensifer sp. ENS07]|uniref:hypothetical protein n=1 Tax=Ensifer sp. ENS07 TaxID=2769274 RepID=UPI00177FC2D7|nr:hypothetical protein [Ensifer sp. ENS07]MBD9641448.1 hypothetical protein [Ensifer sp. ENS07]